MELQYTYISWRVVKEMIALTKILDRLMPHISTSNRWMVGRNILKIESGLEFNNPKHWAAKHVLPFQGWEFNTSSALLEFELPLRFCSAKGFKFSFSSVTGPHKKF
jgi:hypothetical protein